MRSSSRELQPHPMWLFEENYLMIRRLFAELRSGVRFVLSSACGRRTLQVTVDEDTRYTSTLTLTKPFGTDERLLPPLVMRLRVYHDAQLAEVLGYQDCTAIPPPYEASAAQGFARDERRQVNRLLYEVLRHCMDHGYGVSTVYPQTDPA